MNKYKPLNEFRYNKVTKHMNFVFGTNGNKNKSLGLTTEESTFGKKNMPLKYNTQQNSIQKSYIRNGYITQKSDTYSHTTNNHCFHPEDYPNVKSKIRNYKRNNKKMW